MSFYKTIQENIEKQLVNDSENDQNEVQWRYSILIDDIEVKDFSF